MPLPFPAAIAVATLALLALPSSASAGELELGLSASGGASTWESDPTAFGTMRLGYRFIDLVAIQGMGRLGYAGVDQRVIVGVGLGAQIWGRLGVVRPFARLTLVHQHEEPVDALTGDIGGALFGVGDGIRHRAGLEVFGGVDIPLVKKGSLGVELTLEAGPQWFPDERGPRLYFLGGAGLRIGYAL